MSRALRRRLERVDASRTSGVDFAHRLTKFSGAHIETRWEYNGQAVTEAEYESLLEAHPNAYRLHIHVVNQLFPDPYVTDP